MEAYLLHDANAGSNLKLMIMIQEEGMKGYGIYWTVLEFLRLQNEYKASLKVIPIAFLFFLFWIQISPQIQFFLFPFFMFLGLVNV